MSARLLTAALVLAALVLAPGAPAFAQDAPLTERRLGVDWRDGVPHVSFSARDLVTQAVRERLDSMLPQQLLMRVYAYRESGQPIAMAPRACRVLWDSWAEEYTVEIRDHRTDGVRSFRTLESVMRRCLVAEGLPIGEASDYRGLTGEAIYFAVIVELNPLSPDTVHRIRRWLARSGGGGEEAFFGPMVSVFVNRRIGAAERTLRFRTPRAAALTVPR